jgi:MFS family permease
VFKIGRESAAALGEARWVIASIAVSAFGTWSYNVGLAVYAFERTHSAGWVAAATIGRYVPALILSAAGARFVDRLPRKALAVSADATCAVVMLVLAALAVAVAPLWLIILVAAVSSTMARVQAAAVMALAADVVTESKLSHASVLAGGAEAVATAAGSAAASILLIWFTAPTVFVLNAVTFAASAALLGRVRAARVPRRVAATAKPAVARPRRRLAFWPLQAVRALTAFVYGADVVLLTVVASRQLHSGTSGYGWLLAAAGLGGLLAIEASRRGDLASHTATAAVAGLLLYVAPVAFFALDPAPAVDIVVQVVRGIGSVLVTSTVMIALQRSVPSAIAGRVFGATHSLVLSGTCLGALAAPVLLSAVGFEAAVLVGTAVPILALLALVPFLYRFERGEADLLSELDPHLATLRGLELLRDASRSTLYEIADNIEHVKVGHGDAIVTEGEPADALYVLLDGAVDVTGQRPTGPVFYRTMQAPAYFGEIGLLNRVPRTATVRATGVCELWRIPAPVFLSAVSTAGVSGALTDTMRFRFDTAPVSAGV